MSGYAELHCISNFTFLRGASHPGELVQRAFDLGYRALALTDECSVAGVVRAHTTARELGLHLIIGSEFILENQRYIGRVANINPLILVNGSVYWIDPESHGIRFNGDGEEILKANKQGNVPSSKWYSVNPYIDADVRKKRFEKIVVSLIDGGFVLGPWAQKIYEEVKNNRDAARTGVVGTA